MKRTLSLILSVLMVFCMIPASLFSAVANGLGVAANNIENLSIDNAPGQKIPATIEVDGDYTDTGWETDTWKEANSSTATWSKFPPKNTDFTYKYQVRRDYDYLYGVFVIPTDTIHSPNTLGEITVWLNKDASVNDHATGKVVLTVAEGTDGALEVTCARYAYDGGTFVKVSDYYDNYMKLDESTGKYVPTSVTTLGETEGYGDNDVDSSSSYYDEYDALLTAGTNNNGVYVVEFRTLLSVFDKGLDNGKYTKDNNEHKNTDALSTYSSVTLNGTDGSDYSETLYHPAVQLDDESYYVIDSSPDVTWPATAATVTQSDMLDGSHNYGKASSVNDFDADYNNTLPSDSKIDGIFSEDYWISMTDYYYQGEQSRWEYQEAGEYKYLDLSENVGYSDYHSLTNDNTGGTSGEYKGKTLEAVTATDFSNSSALRYKYMLNVDADDIFGAMFILSDIYDCVPESMKYETDNDSTDSLYQDLKITIYIDAYNGSAREAYMGSISVTYRSFLEEYVKDASANEVDWKINTSKSKVISWSFNPDGDKQDGKESSGTSIDDAPFHFSIRRVSRYEVSLEWSIKQDKYLLLGETAGDRIAVNTIVEEVNQTDADIAWNDGTLDRTAVANKKYEYAKTWNDYILKTEFVGDKPVCYLGVGEDGLNSNYWGPLTAADKFVNGMARSSSGADAVLNKGTAERYAYRIYDDYDYLYGAAIIYDGDGYDKIENRNEGFRLWLKKSNVWNSDWKFDVVANFFIEDGKAVATLTNGSFDGTTKRAYTSEDISRIEVAMKVLDKTEYAYLYDDWEEDYNQTANSASSYESDVSTDGAIIVLEFKIPIDLLSEENEPVDNAYSTSKQIEYFASYGDMSYAEALVHPMTNNNAYNRSAIIGSDKETQTPLRELAFYSDQWHVSEAAVINGSNRIINAINVDGILAENYWNEDGELITVTQDNAYWLSSMPDTEERLTFGQRVYAGPSYLYGIAKINEAAVMNDDKTKATVYTLYLNHRNSDGTVASESAAEKIEIWLNSDGETEFHAYSRDESDEWTETPLHAKRVTATDTDGKGYKTYDYNCDPADYTHHMAQYKMNTANGVTTIEFNILNERLGIDIENDNGFEYVVTVSHPYQDEEGNTSENQTLVYPKPAAGTYSYGNTAISELNGAASTLWITGYIDENGYVSNESAAKYGSAAGLIVTSDYDSNLAGSYNVSARLWLFAPTDIEGVYEVKKSSVAADQVEAFNEAYGADAAYYPYFENDAPDLVWSPFLDCAEEIPDGGFIYILHEGKESTQAYSTYLSYNAYSDKYVGGTGRSLFSVGNYIKFEGLDLENNEVHYVLDEQRLPYDTGYRSDATVALYGNIYAKGSADRHKDLSATYPTETTWDKEHDHTVKAIDYFVPETITIDGKLSDTGWDEDAWIEVKETVNGNLQSSIYECATEYNYKYQLRTDGDYLYIAAILERGYEDDVYINDDGEYRYSTPSFRIWIRTEEYTFEPAVGSTLPQSVIERLGSPSWIDDNGKVREEGHEVTLYEDELRSFTHLYDVGNKSSTKNNATPSENTVGVNAASVKYVGADTSVTYNGADKDAYGNATSGSVTYSHSSLRYAMHQAPYLSFSGNSTGEDSTVLNTTDYTDSLIYGYTKVIEENLNNGWGGYLDDEWYAVRQTNSYVIGTEHGIMTAAPDGLSTYVEFKVAIDEFDPDRKGFEYYVQNCSTGNKNLEPYTIFYPPVEDQFGTNGGWNTINNPVNKWSDNAIKVDEQALYDMSLRNHYGPVASLGAKINPEYIEEDGSSSRVIRFGAYYDSQYYVKSTGDESRTYWDNQECGMILASVDRLTLTSSDGYKHTLEPTIEDTLGDNPIAIQFQSDQIENWTVEGSNFADYKNYVYYIMVWGIDGTTENTRLVARPFLDYYEYKFDTKPLNDDNPLENGAVDNGDGTQTGMVYYREAGCFYAPSIARSYSQVEQLAKRYTQAAEDGSYDSENLYTDSAPVVKNPEIDENSIQVVYIPIDDRTVNTTRVQYLAEESGIDLIMPNAEYYSTYLDTDYANPETKPADPDQQTAPTEANKKAYAEAQTAATQNNSAQLYTWLSAKVEETGAPTYYVLSLDQVFSSGLVNSRTPNIEGTIDAANGVYTLSDLEKDWVTLLRKIAQDESKHVIFFDTVVRLATTENYKGLDINVYEATRAYGKSARPSLSGDQLTVAEIFKGYNQNADGSERTTADFHESWTLAQYQATRLRKLTLISYLLGDENCNGVIDASETDYRDAIETLFCGVDDSSPELTIQTNEIAYLEKLVDSENHENLSVFAGTDDLGISAMSHCVTDIYNSVSEVNVNVIYYGSGADLPADGYDKGTLRESVEAHIKAAGASISESDNAIELLVLTRGDNASAGYSSDERKTYIEEAKQLLERLEHNLAYNIPTAVINAGGYSGVDALYNNTAAYNGGVEFDFYEELYSLPHIGRILGYSHWNTASNATGISVSNAVARYSYLTNSSRITEASHDGFMKSLTHMLVKDIAYQNRFCDAYNDVDGDGIANGNEDESVYYNDGDTNYAYEKEHRSLAIPAFQNEAEKITAAINASEILVHIEDGIGESGKYRNEVLVGELSFPWDRTFEADFPIIFTNGVNLVEGYTSADYGKLYGVTDGNENPEIVANTDYLFDGQFGEYFKYESGVNMLDKVWGSSTGALVIDVGEDTEGIAALRVHFNNLAGSDGEFIIYCSDEERIQQYYNGDLRRAANTFFEHTESAAAAHGWTVYGSTSSNHETDTNAPGDVGNWETLYFDRDDGLNYRYLYIRFLAVTSSVRYIDEVEIYSAAIPASDTATVSEAAEETKEVSLNIATYNIGHGTHVDTELSEAKVYNVSTRSEIVDLGEYIGAAAVENDLEVIILQETCHDSRIYGSYDPNDGNGAADGYQRYDMSPIIAEAAGFKYWRYFTSGNPLSDEYCKDYGDETDYGGTTGFTLLSKYPIVSEAVYALDEDMICAYAEILKDGVKLDVFGTHLLSNPSRSASKTAQREAEYEKLANIIRGQEDCILLGDFNEPDYDHYEKHLPLSQIVESEEDAQDTQYGGLGLGTYYRFETDENGNNVYDSNGCLTVDGRKNPDNILFSSDSFAFTDRGVVRDGEYSYRWKNSSGVWEMRYLYDDGSTVDYSDHDMLWAKFTFTAPADYVM